MCSASILSGHFMGSYIIRELLTTLGPTQNRNNAIYRVKHYLVAQLLLGMIQRIAHFQKNYK